jgi:hypothetical protein
MSQLNGKTATTPRCVDTVSGRAFVLAFDILGRVTLGMILALDAGALSFKFRLPP